MGLSSPLNLPFPGSVVCLSMVGHKYTLDPGLANTLQPVKRERTTVDEEIIKSTWNFPELGFGDP